MGETRATVLASLRREYKNLTLAQPPRWLARARWKPPILLAASGDPRIVAVDIIPSSNIPKAIYRGEVSSLLAGHPNLRVVVCVSERGFHKHPDTESFCRTLKLGLKTIIPGLGLQTILPIDLDGRGERGHIPAEGGWFPHAILSEITGLKRLAFASTVRRFAERIRGEGGDKDAAFGVVRDTIDELLQHYPQCHPGTGSFMKLAHFERLLRLASPSSSEHVFHSFRVFLAGCPIVDAFYDDFHSAHSRFRIGDPADLSVEYCWLLASIFHDIGRPLEKAAQVLEEELEDEDVAVSVSNRETRWLKEEYQAARRILGSLGAFVTSEHARDGSWDGSVVPDQRGTELGVAWTAVYDSFESHAVVGAINLLADIIRKASAADQVRHRPFVVSHAAPAALSVLLHDWRIWGQARKWRLFPIDAGVLPMAALLVFLDTWDDYKRSDGACGMFLKDFTVDRSGVSAAIEWASSELLEKEKLKYRAFRSAIRRSPFPMRISVSVARP